MGRLYTSDCPVFRSVVAEEDLGRFHLSEEDLVHILRQIYDRDFNPETDIQRELYSHTLKFLNDAVDKGFMLKTEENREFIEQLKYNNAVFAAFKTHREQNDLAELLLDGEGKPRSFSDFRKATEPVIGAYNVNWLHTEYLTAIKSARTAEMFKRFEADKDLFPNVRWLPSRAVEPRESHRVYWNQVRRLDDRWWLTHYPGCLWGCQCDVENTADPITHIGYNPVDPNAPTLEEDTKEVSPGLDQNPVFTGSIFTKTHPYITEAYPSAKEAVEHFMGNQAFKEKVKQQRQEIRDWAKLNLLDKTANVPKLSREVSFTSTGIKEALNQPHKYLLEKNEAVRDILHLIQSGKYVRFDPDIKGNQMVRGYHYIEIEIEGEPSFIVIRELNNGGMVFYSIVDKLKKKE